MDRPKSTIASCGAWWKRGSGLSRGKSEDSSKRIERGGKAATEPEEPETEEQFLDRRIRQMIEGATEAIRLEVEWLRKHNFPVWIYRNGEIVDARDEDPRGPTD